jgi:Tfp pilus assembly protein PilO
MPLVVKLYRSATRLNELETELLTQRGVVATSDKPDTKVEVMPRNEVPLAIAELTAKGRNIGLSFSSIATQRLRKTSSSDSRRWPVTFAVKSEYQNLGEFLVYVEEFPRTLVEVESLFIRPIGDDPSELSVGLVLDLYVEI